MALSQPPPEGKGPHGSHERRPIPSSADSSRSRQIGLLFLFITAVGWGLNWPVIKLVLREWPPLFSRGVAGVTAALALGLMAILNGQRVAIPSGVFGRLATAAALNVFAWMGFGTMAMVWLSVSEGALLVYTMPIWAMLIAWPILGERPTLRGVGALGLGFCGLVVLFAGQDLTLGGEKSLGIVLALGAAVLFALGTVVLRAALPLPPMALTAWQVGLGCLPMVVVGLLFERTDFGALSIAGWAAMAYMTIIPMGVCYLTWFAALRRLPPATASVATLLTPVVGVVAAGLALGEPLGVRELSALALTLGGVALALAKG
jgi:drug/metabolite transporter (DMT)-like permease